jgi:hypothetical protein
MDDNSVVLDIILGDQATYRYVDSIYFHRPATRYGSVALNLVIVIVCTLQYGYVSTALEQDTFAGQAVVSALTALSKHTF